MNIKVIDVKALECYKLLVAFNNGIRKVYDVSRMFDRFPDMFQPFLDNPAIFKNVKVDCGGSGIAWNSEIDLPEWELWENGEETE